MSDTLWGDLARLGQRMEQLEERVYRLASTTPAELICTLEGLRCALGVVERRVRELEARQEVLAETMSGVNTDRQIRTWRSARVGV